MKSTNTKFIEGSLPLLKNRETRFIFLNDVHYPHNVPLKPIFAFIKDFKPDYALAGGDIINGDPFSHWERNVPKAFKNLPDPKEYYEDCDNGFYKPLRESVGDGTVIHWIGNHEFWAQKAIMQFPEGQGYWEIWNNINPEFVNSWVPSKKLANLGKLHFMHGDFSASKDSHAKKFLLLFLRNLRYGHWHDIQEASYCSPIDQKERWTARSCGCLQKSNPDYMQNSPHNWVNAFTYGVVSPSGLFWDTTVKIIEGKFWAEGHLYKS